MDIANYSHRCAYVHDIALSHQHLLCFFTNLLEYRLVKQLFFQQLGDTCVQIERGHSENVRVSASVFRRCQ